MTESELTVCAVAELPEGTHRVVRAGEAARCNADHGVVRSADAHDSADERGIESGATPDGVRRDRDVCVRARPLSISARLR